MLFSSLKERNDFIENNLGLVKSRVLKLNNNKFDDDLYQVGSLALVISTDRFDKSFGTEFSTYAVKCIDGYILKYKKYDSLIKPLQERGKWNFLYWDVISLNEKLDGSNATLGNIVCSNDDIEKSILDEITINEFLNSLSDRDRLVIELKIEDLNQSKISKIVGVSQQYVSRIVNRRGKQYVNRYVV